VSAGSERAVPDERDVASVGRLEQPAPEFERADWTWSMTGRAVAASITRSSSPTEKFETPIDRA
jgi:hypothetical protein